ncbi:MAG: DUF4292 domain-containing protein [Bacteroidetes bacterium]|nr:MAG: DUF4292 domain-containing protein [Bacteroidota bacterium]
MTTRLAIVLFLSGFTFMACRSNKGITTKPIEQKLDAVAEGKDMKQEKLSRINVSENEFGFYQAKIKAQYKEDNKGLNFDILLVMEKDKYIWMSITALLGIEVARVMITGDSVRIIDRLHKKVILTDFSYLQQMSNVPLQLEHLQRLIVANTIFKNSAERSMVDTTTGELVVYTLLESQKQTTFYNNEYHPQKAIISDLQQQKELKVNYELFTQTDTKSLPTKIDINIRAEKRIDCTFELSNFVFEKKRDVQFNVPSGYEVVKP